MAALAIYVFVLQNNIAFFNQYRMNIHDIGMANRILARIETLPGYSKMKEKRLAVVGRFRPRMNLQVRWSARSAFLAHGGKYYIFRSLGFDFEEVKRDEIRRNADHVKTMHPWPHRKSVTVKDGTIYVMLSHRDR
jgi:hypothetical protein